MTSHSLDQALVFTSYSIRLSPNGSLHFECQEDSSLPPSLKSIHEEFIKNWKAGWFCLAASKTTINNESSAKFWQGIASHYLTALCHLPAEIESTLPQTPETDLLEKWVLQAPPMIGGEYLSKDRLCALWNELDKWVNNMAAECGGIHHFLAKWAPKWQQVGRVCFHLAENKKDADRPFAFLATYSTGFGLEGKLKHLPLKEALQQYSGTNNNQALIKLLTPVHNASKKCSWVQDLLATAEIYQPLAWTPNKAYKFLSSIPQLEECGLSVRIPNWWKQRPRPQVSVTIGSSLKSRLGVSSMLDFNVQTALGDDKLSEEELSELLASDQNLVFLRGKWVEVDREKLQEALNHWKEVKNRCKNGEISFIEGMRLLSGSPTESDGDMTNTEQIHWVKINAGEALAETLKSLKSPSLISSQKLKNITFSLRPYQHEGVSWLSLLSGLGLGACLADDMGLGKTLQILTLLLLNQQNTQIDSKLPSLLIVPASLLGNWQSESKRFTPTLKLFFLHPSETKNSSFAEIEQQSSQMFKDVDLVITTYSMAVKLKWLAQINWNLLILDEAQAIKNTGTNQTKAVKAIPSRSRIALTGTPIENRLSDLWSLFDFLNPGLLGSSASFKKYINRLQDHPEQFESLRRLTSPYILRRMKNDSRIISELPDKVETPAYCYMTKQQVHYYQSIIEELKKSLQTTEPQKRRGIVLHALLQLKQICNHPSHYNGNGDYNPSHSGKFERLKEICEELASRQEKVLIFTQFSEIIPYLEKYLSGIFGRRGLILHGGTPIKERQKLVESFQKGDGPPFFVLSLKAGGTGLTLTEASHVIHFDRWWNPAVENQATDRAFRIGQKKNVQVHKFITQGTVEEQIDEIISSKKKLANEILASPDEIRITELPDDELLNLLALDLNKVELNLTR